MRSASLLGLILTLCACGADGAPNARAHIHNEHSPRVQTLVLETLGRHEAGLKQGADRIAAGFVKVSGEQQETDMRQVLKLIRSPKKGISELVISPMSFLAVVGPDGKVIARDGEAENDKMKGMELAKLFPTVSNALKSGATGMEVGQFESLEKGGEPSVSIVMAAPAHYQGKVVGALVLGIPLWRLQQQLSKQLQMELAGKDRVVVWVYVYKGDKLHMHGTPPDLDKLVPDGNARRAGLAKSAGGFTGEIAQYGFWYGYGVRPLRVLGPDLGVVIFRMEADEKAKS